MLDKDTGDEVICVQAVDAHFGKARAWFRKPVITYFGSR